MKRLCIAILPILPFVALAACGNGNKDVNNADEADDDLDPIEALNKQVEQALAEGGSQDTGTATTPVETTPDDTEDKPKPKGTGPGQLLIHCEAMNEEVPCAVEIQRSEDLSKVEDASENTSHSFTLNPGNYTIQLYFDGAVDKPRLTLQSVEIPPGETVERDVVFPMAKVTFVPVSPSGKKQGGWKLRLKLMGADNWSAENVKINTQVHISPGLYEGQLYKGKGGKKTIDIPKIQINADAITQQPITVTH